MTLPPETLKAFLVVGLLFPLHVIFGVLSVPVLLYQLFVAQSVFAWLFLLCYLPFYLYPAQSRFPGWRGFDAMWRAFDYETTCANYFGKFEVRTAAPLDPAAQYFVASHPHGTLIFQRTFWRSALTEGLFHRPFRMLGASVLFSIPIVREMSLLFGAVDAGKANCERLIRKGSSLIVFPGGIDEMPLTGDGPTSDVRVRTRTGFIRMAVAHGVSVLPTFCFGELEAVSAVSPLPSPLAKWLQKRLRMSTTYPPKDSNLPPVQALSSPCPLLPKLFPIPALSCPSPLLQALSYPCPLLVLSPPVPAVTCPCPVLSKPPPIPVPSCSCLLRSALPCLALPSALPAPPCALLLSPLNDQPSTPTCAHPPICTCILLSPLNGLPSIPFEDSMFVGRFNLFLPRRVPTCMHTHACMHTQACMCTWPLRRGPSHCAHMHACMHARRHAHAAYTHCTHARTLYAYRCLSRCALAHRLRLISAQSPRKSTPRLRACMASISKRCVSVYVCIHACTCVYARAWPRALCNASAQEACGRTTDE